MTGQYLWSYYDARMEKIGAAKFKEQCLAILDRLSSEGVIITKHGKPVAKLLPIEKTSAGFIGRLKGKLRVKGDIEITGVKWIAES